MKIGGKRPSQEPGRAAEGPTEVPSSSQRAAHAMSAPFKLQAESPDLLESSDFPPPEQGKGVLTNEPHEELIPSGDSLSPIPVSIRSTSQSRANEEMAWARENRQTVFDAYAELDESMGGKILNGDLFVTLLPSAYARPCDVHTLDLADMNYLAIDYYDQHVSKPDPKGAGTVVLQVGPAGVGKSTLARELVTKYGDSIHTVLDSNGANFDTLQDVLNTALRHGRTVDVLYVGGDIEGATARTVSRCVVDKRVVPASVQADLHRFTPANFIRAIEHLQQEGVAFLAYDARRRCFADDPVLLAQSDLNHFLNNPAGIASIIKESIRVQELDHGAADAFNS